MFRGSPGFQLAFVLMVLFTAYVLQVKHRPYMSTAERAQCLDYHREKAREGDPFHRVMAPIMEHAIREEKKRMAKQALREKKKKLSALLQRIGPDMETQRIMRVSGGKEYFWNYNTIEATLLACAVFVCLAGIMFESSQFDDRPDLIWMQDMIAVLVGIVLIYSFIYYLAVFSSEVLGKSPKCVLRCCASEKKNEFKESDKNTIRRGSIQMSNINVLSLEDDKRARAAEAESAQLRLELDKQAKKMKILSDKSKKQEKNYKNPLLMKKANRGAIKNFKKKKVAGSQRKASAGLTLEESEILQKRSERLHNNKAEEDKGIDRASLLTKSKLKSFRKHITGDGKSYFEDLNSGSTHWNLPDGGLLVGEDTNKANKNEESRRRRSFVGKRLSMESGVIA